jgi:ABC-type Zn uptake system ZnuABC Zn-binding protein ZnuA
MDKKANEEAILASNVSREGYEPSPDDIEELMRMDIDDNNGDGHHETGHFAEDPCDDKDEDEDEDKDEHI